MTVGNWREASDQGGNNSSRVKQYWPGLQGDSIRLAKNGDSVTIESAKFVSLAYQCGSHQIDTWMKKKVSKVMPCFWPSPFIYRHLLNCTEEGVSSWHFHTCVSCTLIRVTPLLIFLTSPLFPPLPSLEQSPLYFQNWIALCCFHSF
jgi:hypothetical protein